MNKATQNPNVLIVGAGAQGVITGYHLSLAGAKITFLVRENRRAALQAEQILYCYDDASLKQFSSYRVATEIAELTGTHDYVLVTLDGASCRSAEGTKLLTDISNLVRDRDTVVVAGGVGVRDLFIDTMKISESRILEGTLGSLAYQTDRVTLPPHRPTDPRQLQQANFAYHHFSNKTGFMLAAHPRAKAERFAALHSKSGVSKGVTMPPKLFAIISTAFFPIMAVCDLAGWPDASTMATQSELIALGTAAMREVIGLPQHGLLGKLASPLMRKAALAMLLKKMEKDSLPLDFPAFNAFHHGGKVRDQDIQVMHNCIASGAAAGRKMVALRQLVARYEAHCASTPATAVPATLHAVA